MHNKTQTKHTLITIQVNLSFVHVCRSPDRSETVCACVWVVLKREGVGALHVVYLIGVCRAPEYRGVKKHSLVRKLQLYGRLKVVNTLNF